jgi:hypothetical protein
VRTEDTVPLKGFVFECRGARVGLKSNTSSILQAMKDCVPPASKRIDVRTSTCLFSIIRIRADIERTKKYTYTLYRRKRLLRQTESLESVLSELESRLHFAIALEASPWLFIHAGVVGWNRGAIVIPGRSGSGKSTLVAALISAGADYYSDEYAVFDESGYVHPYPKPLFFREPYRGRSGKCTIEELGGRVGTTPLPVKLVVATQYDEQARWEPKVLAPGQTVLRLLENTVCARKRGRYAIGIGARVAVGSLAIGGLRPAWERVVPSLLEFCGGEGHGLKNENGLLHPAQHNFAVSLAAPLPSMVGHTETQVNTSK